MNSNELGDIREKLGIIDGKLDMLLGQSLDKRVCSLERARAWLTGAVAVLGAIVTAAFRWHS